MIAMDAHEKTNALNSVRKTVTVAAPQKTAFDVFTLKMSSWWPLATHHIGKAEAKEVVFEPRVGGRCFERGTDGSECVWGHVLVWESPKRVVFSWEISSEWQPDPKTLTEVEVHFIAESASRTRVELEHRNLDRYGAKRDEVRAALDSEGGWNGLLLLFAKSASSA